MVSKACTYAKAKLGHYRFILRDGVMVARRSLEAEIGVQLPVPQQMNVYLVRHATYTNKYNLLPGRLPVELSQKGIKESEILKNYFKSKNITRIYSSAVLRCKQTAEIISDNIIPITYDKRLLESFSAYQGYWNPNAWDHFWGHRQELGGESDEDVRKRVLDFFNSIVFDKNKNYIICSHGDPLYYIYEQVSAVPKLKHIELGDEVKSPDDYQQKASVRILIRNDNRWAVQKTLNQNDL
jgi:broad specificity phosphatase PhoE